MEKYISVIGVKNPVRGKLRGKQAKMNSKKALKPLSFKAFSCGGEGGIRIIEIIETIGKC